MGLFDRFKTPKWEHEDPKVRLEAVKELDDQKELVKIAKTSSYSDVREAACEKINNDSLLADVAKYSKDDNVCILVVERISDESVLADVAKNNKNEFVRRLAFEKITDESLLADVAKVSSIDISIDAVERISDESLLIDIALTNKSWSVRGEAVKKINNPSVLIDIAKRDKDDHVRSLAFEKITDESVLIDRLKKDRTPNVRRVIVKRISDESVLIDIAKHDKDPFVRQGAVMKISDESVLADVAKNDSDWVVRKAAVEKISDESVLIDIAKNDEEYYVRKNAVGKISDESVLIDIAKNDEEYYVRREAIRNIYDESVLINFVNDQDDTIRAIAVERISDESVLIDIAKNEEDQFIRQEAVKKVVDKNVLEEVLKNDPSDSIKLLAKSILNKEEILKKRNFTYLNYLIQTSEKEIILDSDINLESEEESYFKNGIEIYNDDLVIDGNGFCIDAGGKVPFFIIKTIGITFKNIKFTNGVSKNINCFGRNICFINCIFEKNSDCIIFINSLATKFFDCVFKNNNAQIIRNLKYVELHNSNFEDNEGIIFKDKESDHIIYNNDDNIMELEDCVFKNNKGGVINNKGKLSLLHCTFEGNNQEKSEGGAIISGYDQSKTICTVSECNFIKNNARNGGAIYSYYGKIDIDNSYFKENSAFVNGAVLYNDLFSICNFKNSKLEDNISKDNNFDVGVIFNNHGLKSLYDTMMGYSGGGRAILKYWNLEFVNNKITNIINAGKIER